MTKNNQAKIFVYKSLESTNNTAKEMAANGYGHGTVIIAESQTAGRGRYGKSFFSPSGGLYMSFIIEPKMHIQAATLLTASAAVAVCRAVNAVSGEEPCIKWVNDVFLNKRKICGILTEAVSSNNSGERYHMVVGIGINVDVRQEDLPQELRGIVGAVFPNGAASGVKQRLTDEIIERIVGLDTWVYDKSIYQEYKSRSMILGNRITVYAENDAYAAYAEDIDFDGRLILKKDNGETVRLASGSVVLREEVNEKK